LVIGTGQPHDLNFANVSGREAVPAGATVLAICDGDRLVSQLDEDFFAAITDEEYYTYMALLRDAVAREKKLLRKRQAATTVRRFINWLSGPVAEDAAIHESGS
jgi:hypothetical protein